MARYVYTAQQARYFDAIRNVNNHLILGVGPAGTGKTSIPCTIAADMLAKKQIKKILITRPAVCADESHGYLPGNIDSKMLPYMLPIYDCFTKAGISNDVLRAHLVSQTIEICPFSYIRGRTFSNCFLLADETQNCTPNQIKMLLTRAGENCKMVLTGDPDQSDLPEAQENGLSDLLGRIAGKFEEGDESLFDVIHFGQEDIVRSKIVRRVLELYDERPFRNF